MPRVKYRVPARYRDRRDMRTRLKGVRLIIAGRTSTAETRARELEWRSEGREEHTTEDDRKDEAAELEGVRSTMGFKER